MREFADCRISREDEYRLMYEDEVEQNKKLKLVNKDQQNVIEALQQRLIEMERKLAGGQTHCATMDEKVKVETQKSEQLEKKCNKKEVEIIRVSRECKYQEQQAEKLSKLSIALLQKLESVTDNQLILSDKIDTLEQRVERQKTVIKEKESANKKLSNQIIDLVKICRTAEEKLDLDDKTIQDLKITISQQDSSIKLYEAFERRFKTRENEILLKLEQLEIYTNAKSRNRCFAGFRRRPTQAQCLVESVCTLFLGNLSSGVQQRSSDFNERLI